MKIWIKRIFSLCLFAGLWTFASAKSVAQKPNIVLLYADDLGYSDLSIYGNEYQQTPHIDSLMRQGMRFTQAYSPAPLCAPSRVGVLSGRYPARVGCYEVVTGVKARGVPLDELPFIQPDNRLGLPDDDNTLGELLKADGYRCGVFGKWHLGKDRPADRGFDEYVMLRNGGHLDVRKSYMSQSGGYPKPSGYSSDYINRCVEAFLEKDDGRPFFLYLPHTLVHTAMGKDVTPLEPKPEFEKKYLERKRTEYHSNAAYAGMVESLDQSVGDFVALLKKRSFWKDTIVIFTSDNGALLGGTKNLKASNGLSLGRYTSNYPLKLGKSTLWEGGIRVPMSVSWPGKIQPGTVSDALVTQVDYLPTLLDVIGSKRKLRQPMDGKTLWPLLSGESETDGDRMLFWHYPGYRMSLVEGQRPASAMRWRDWKLIESLEDGSVSLYNLKDDISELKDIAAEHPERAARMKKELKKWRAEIGAPMPIARK